MRRQSLLARLRPCADAGFATCHQASVDKSGKDNQSCGTPTWNFFAVADAPAQAANTLPQLPLARYRLRFRRSPDARALEGRYLGSAWRGAFGHALRRSVCITNLPRCDNCALLAHCVYPRTFEKRTPADAQKLRRYPTTPNPYVLAPAYDDWDVADETINLGVTLFGATANDDLPTILHALRQAAQTGLTTRRVVLEHVETQAEVAAGHSWTTVQRQDGNLRRSSAFTAAPPPMPPPTALRVRLLSPLRIRAEGHYVRPRQFGFRAFAANLLRRISLLTYFFGEQPLEVPFAALLDEAANIDIEDADLRWWEGTRHSSRQRARIPMGGIIGSFVARGPAVAALWPCLWLGQWTHIGKACTMGLGRYVVEPLDPDSADTWQGPAPL